MKKTSRTDRVSIILSANFRGKYPFWLNSWAISSFSHPVLSKNSRPQSNACPQNRATGKWGYSHVIRRVESLEIPAVLLGLRALQREKGNPSHWRVRCTWWGRCPGKKEARSEDEAQGVNGRASGRDRDEGGGGSTPPRQSLFI